MKKTLIISSILLCLSSNYLAYSQDKDISNLVYAHQGRHIFNLKVFSHGCKIMKSTDANDNDLGKNFLLDQSNIIIDTLNIKGTISYLGIGDPTASIYTFGTGKTSGTIQTKGNCSLNLMSTSAVSGFNNLGKFSFGQLLGNIEPWKLNELSYYINKNDIIQKVYQIDLTREKKKRDKYPMFPSEQEEWFIHGADLYINNSYEQALLKIDTSSFTLEKIKFPPSQGQYYCFYDQSESKVYLLEWFRKGKRARLYTFEDLDINKVTFIKELPNLPLAIEDGFWYCSKMYEGFLAVFRYPIEEGISKKEDFKLLQETSSN